ncbi:MAG: branched-chain amino acid aminotransferase [Propionibacteriaceae bacterium]|jgi:branched-chain amino acid aminotransferase|nr:branched-chain amino acid aminotransferase [Propionibacteriaceae bacterium]
MSLSFDLVPGTPVTAPEEIARVLSQDPGFGIHFSDHMALATWTDGIGWHDDQVTAYAPFQVDPGDAVLHYAQEIFEGLKAYRHADGSIWLFRPEKNAQRFIRSAERMDLPRLEAEDFITAVTAVTRADAAWVPGAEEQSLYIRPFMFAAESFLGVRSAKTVTFATIAGPAGAYFKTGLSPVDIWVTTTWSRAGDGGTGAAKCGGNYASSLIAGKEAYAHGCGQVLFTDAATHSWLEELGGMNVFIVTQAGELVTPPTSGTILDGVTRDSILQLAPRFGLKPVERPIALAELLEGIASGAIPEAFACGTAAVITPISAFRYAADGGDQDATLANPFGQATAALRRQLVDIQWGRAADEFGWTTRVA